MKRPAATLAPVELSLLVDGVAGKGKRRLPSTFGTDYGGALKIALMCHRNILLILLSVITVSFTMILGIVGSSDE